LEEKPQEIAVRIEEPQAQTPAKTADRILGEIGDYCRVIQSSFDRFVVDFSGLKLFRNKYVAAIAKFNFFPGAHRPSMSASCSR
jgi:hypothetical protein